VLPNPFTPNDDGYNDYVTFKYPEMDSRKPVVRIFNLRGRKVNELGQFTGNEFRWNGKDEDGMMLDPGVYLYILEVDNNRIASGTITLIK
jgi:gliding motility-associated-like protein